MFSLSLARTLRGPGITGQVLGRSLAPALPSRRWIFNPSLNPPSSGPSVHKEFPPETRAHLSTPQFQAIRSHTPSNEFSGLLDGSTSSSDDFQNMTPEHAWASKTPKSVTLPPSKFAGRSIPVGKEGVVPAWGKLQSILRTNNIRRELRAMERHEKKGVKRRRLRSERWKRKFADEVRKKVKLVTEIRLRDRMWGARH